MSVTTPAARNSYPYQASRSQTIPRPNRPTNPRNLEDSRGELNHQWSLLPKCKCGHPLDPILHVGPDQLQIKVKQNPREDNPHLRQRETLTYAIARAYRKGTECLAFVVSELGINVVEVPLWAEVERANEILGVATCGKLIDRYEGAGGHEMSCYMAATGTNDAPHAARERREEAETFVDDGEGILEALNASHVDLRLIVEGGSDL